MFFQLGADGLLVADENHTYVLHGPYAHHGPLHDVGRGVVAAHGVERNGDGFRLYGLLARGLPLRLGLGLPGFFNRLVPVFLLGGGRLGFVQEVTPLLR